jgi:beta-N-acetylhexosaminidase
VRAVRRRLLAAAFVTLALGALAGGEARATQHAVDALTLEQQVGQLLVLRFRGDTPPGYVRRALEEQRVAGVILFRDNIRSPGQLRTLTRALRRAGGNPIVSVDQEGGDIRRVPWAPPVSSPAGQLAAGTVGADSTAGARALRSLGITVTFAPVADVPSVPRGALASRAFSRDPAEVRRAVRVAVAGWRAGGVAATAKHFPGLGGASANTDDAVSTIRRSRRALETVDLPPFEAAIAAGVPLVMVGHARYPALDTRRVASQSREIVDGLLRQRLGFRGVIVTDSMEARASLSTGGLTVVSERAVRAGVDLVLLTGRGSYTPVYRHLLAVARRSPSFRARVRESAARVLELRARGAQPPR